MLMAMNLNIMSEDYDNEVDDDEDDEDDKMTTMTTKLIPV